MNFLHGSVSFNKDRLESKTAGVYYCVNLKSSQLKSLHAKTCEFTPFIMDATNMNPDQTASLREQSDLGQFWSGCILFAIKTTKVHKQMREQMTIVVNAVKRFYNEITVNLGQTAALKKTANWFPSLMQVKSIAECLWGIFAIRGAFGKFLAWSIISLTNWQILSCLVSFLRTIFLLCYSTHFMRMSWWNHEIYYCEYIYCLYTGKLKILVENITFYL